MIVRMKHLDLVCIAADKEATLERLRGLGVVHLNLDAAQNAAVASAKGEIDDAEKAVNYGAAHGALAMTTPGDTSMATKADVEKLVGGGSARVDR